MEFFALPGDRIRVHPASDWFMRGVKYATVAIVGRKWIHVTSDAGHRIKLSPANVMPLEGWNG